MDLNNYNPDKDWKEDLEYSNGWYFHVCKDCKTTFLGYKRRNVCRECYTEDVIPNKPKELHELVFKSKEEFEAAVNKLVEERLKILQVTRSYSYDEGSFAPASLRGDY